MFGLAAPGVSAETLSRELAETKRTAQTVLGTGGNERTDYLKWTNVEIARLRRLVTPEALSALVTTARYSAILTLDPATDSALVRDLVSAEMMERVQLLTEVSEGASIAMRYWQSRPGRYVLPDTNIFLHHKDEFDQVDWRGLAQARQYDHVFVVVPLVVVDELDALKRKGQNPQRKRAKDAIKRLAELFEYGNSEPMIGSGQLGGKLTAELLPDDPMHVRLPDADSEIVAVAKRLQGFTGYSVTLATFDTGMAFRSRMADLPVNHLGDTEQSVTSQS